ncbi:hypothetical protein [Dyadobacter diqingensis]|uniref:hypothetical protein n=1 Tax=Dyadobacter diqingensis TaxID=2938121 RepID=UPI0020C3A6E9|nr:hypothetical protein [Dyadobacter diqingensis]
MMRKLLLLVLFFAAFYASGQIVQPQSPKKKPAYFLDSKRLPGMPIMGPDKIKDIYISYKIDSIPNTSGAMFIITKNPSENKFLTAQDIAQNNGIDPTSQVIYMVDNELKKDISTFVIDSSYIFKTIITKGTEFENLKEQLPNLTILHILTKTKENIDKVNTIRIRGSVETALK